MKCVYEMWTKDIEDKKRGRELKIMEKGIKKDILSRNWSVLVKNHE